jgi:hypothetical protein
MAMPRHCMYTLALVLKREKLRKHLVRAYENCPGVQRQALIVQSTVASLCGGLDATRPLASGDGFITGVLQVHVDFLN